MYIISENQNQEYLLDHFLAWLQLLDCFQQQLYLHGFVEKVVRRTSAIPLQEHQQQPHFHEVDTQDSNLACTILQTCKSEEKKKNKQDKCYLNGILNFSSRCECPTSKCNFLENQRSPILVLKKETKKTKSSMWQAIVLQTLAKNREKSLKNISRTWIQNSYHLCWEYTIRFHPSKQKGQQVHPIPYKGVFQSQWVDDFWEWSQQLCRAKSSLGTVVEPYSHFRKSHSSNKHLPPLKYMELCRYLGSHLDERFKKWRGISCSRSWKDSQVPPESQRRQSHCSRRQWKNCILLKSCILHMRHSGATRKEDYVRKSTFQFISPIVHNASHSKTPERLTNLLIRT